MKKEYDMVLEGKNVTLSHSRKKVQLDEDTLDVRTISIGKKRKNSTFNIILYLLAVMVAGVLLYAALNAFIGGDDEGEPYQELDNFSKIEYREFLAMEPSSLFLVTEGTELIDLSDSVTWKDGGVDTVSIRERVMGQTTLCIMWYGDANELRTREIGHLKIVIDSVDDHRLQNVELIVLDVDKMIDKRVQVTLPSSIERVNGRSIYEINVEDPDMGAARNLQSGLSSSQKATLIRITFPEGISPGTIDINAEWGPDYYHETTQRGLLIGGVSAIITIGALFIVYSRVGKDDACLTIDTDDTEYVLFGANEDISKAYLEISKITIPRMKGGDRRKKYRPGITKGEDLIDKDEAVQIGKELKKRPGGSGKMIYISARNVWALNWNDEFGFMTGYKYHCKNCDYVGSFVIEKQVDFDQ